MCVCVCLAFGSSSGAKLFSKFEKRLDLLKFRCSFVLPNVCRITQAILFIPVAQCQIIEYDRLMDRLLLSSLEKEAAGSHPTARIASRPIREWLGVMGSCAPEFIEKKSLRRRIG